MSKLNKKILRDIKLNKMQFFNIFIMVFLGVFVFAGIHSYMDGMRVSGNKYYENNNLQDIWLTGENFSAEDLNNVKKINNVRNAQRVLSIQTDLENYKDVALETNFIESNEISKMYIVDGEEFSKEKSGLWLSTLDIILGLPLGFIMTDYIFKSALGDSYDFSASIKITSYLLSIFGSFVVSIIVNKVLARKIKTIDMVTSLKGNE